MTRDEIKDLLISVKSFYPRFSLVDVNAYDEYVVRSQTLDSWFDMIGYKSKQECQKLLQDYISGPNGDKMPGVSLFTGRQRSGVILTGTAYRKDFEVIYQPDKSEQPKRLRVRWTGSAWLDVEGRMWAEPDEQPHPELVTDFQWEGEGEYADRIRECMPQKAEVEL